MSKIVPFREDFETVGKFEVAAWYILLLSTLLLIVSFLLEKYSPGYKVLSDWIDRVNCFFIISYAAIELYINNYGFFNASIKKREDFIDNSFNSSLGLKNSENYFSNDELEGSIYKMGVNTFENVLFSYNIAKEMRFTILTKCFGIALVFVACAICGYDNTIILIIQLSLPILLIQQAVKHSIFVNRLEKNLKCFCRMFNNLKNGSKKEYIPEIICNVMEYEVILTWGSTILNNKIFNKLNPSLSKEWDSTKEKYNIQ